MADQAITVNFEIEEDKEQTQNIMKSIKTITGENNPVILNKALRLYLQFVSDSKDIERICNIKKEFDDKRNELISYLHGFGK